MEDGGTPLVCLQSLRKCPVSTERLKISERDDRGEYLLEKVAWNGITCTHGGVSLDKEKGHLLV